MKLNIYVIVFAAIAALIVVAALSTFLFNKSAVQSAYSTSNLANLGPAPPIQGIAYWINSQPLTLSQLKGKVVLLDFWTYSCINCIRTIPYLEAWEQKYGSEGLVIIGIQSPEFNFEKNYTNVLNAVKRFNITYPVAMDNNHSTWNAYGNQYWPEDYFIDKNGDVRYIQIGEGDYAQDEEIIQELLRNASYNVSTGLVNVTSNVNFSQIGTEETYLGYATARAPIGNSQGFVPNSTVNYTITGKMQNNTAYFSGEWYNAPDSMISVNDSELFLTYKAKNLNIVAGGNSTITVMLDGRNLNQSYLGAADTLSNGTATVRINSSRLYNIVAGPSYGWHTVEIIAKPGFRIYTFTFG